VNAPEAIGQMKTNAAVFDLETIFRAQYERIARVIARMVRDPARAEELAVDVFRKPERNSLAQGQNAEGWLYRVAIRTGLDELPRQQSNSR
jgi:DNA-directed RNA polymerase specialized sigma24 family protein